MPLKVFSDLGVSGFGGWEGPGVGLLKGSGVNIINNNNIWNDFKGLALQLSWEIKLLHNFKFANITNIYNIDTLGCKRRSTFRTCSGGWHHFHFRSSRRKGVLGWNHIHVCCRVKVGIQRSLTILISLASRIILPTRIARFCPSSSILGLNVNLIYNSIPNNKIFDTPNTNFGVLIITGQKSRKI